MKGKSLNGCGNPDCGKSLELQLTTFEGGKRAVFLMGAEKGKRVRLKQGRDAAQRSIFRGSICGNKTDGGQQPLRIEVSQ